jgi:hypothetical protein
MSAILDGAPYMRGEYFSNGNQLTMKVTEFNGSHPDFANSGLGSGWITRADYQALLGATASQVNKAYPTSTSAYSITDNKLSMRFFGSPSVLTKR